jgi:hypothetical protein
MLVLLLLLFADPASFDAVFRAGLTAPSQNQLAAARGQLETASKLKPMIRASGWRWRKRIASSKRTRLP